MPTIAGFLRDRANDPRPGLLFEDETWSYTEFVAACAERASLIAALGLAAPAHIGVLLDNIPEFPMWLGAAALVGTTVVGINPTRRGAELARDITHTECRLIVTEEAHLPLLAGLDIGLDANRILVVDDRAFSDVLLPHRKAALPTANPSESDRYLLLFTSGTSGAPKAVICSQGRLARISESLAQRQQLTEDDVCYQAMPLFHSNAIMAGWGPALAAGATSALRRKFSASGFLPDVRRFRATYFNYVGRPLSYILATPEQPDDADNPLTRVFGNEGAEQDLARFATRFGCTVTDGYGSTEGGATVQRTDDMPPGALGRAPEGTRVLDPETGRECPPARFDEHGRLLNADDAIGELVNELGASGFEGYWKNDEAGQARLRDGKYWTGDLAYRDGDGFFYFAGRDFEWLRVDGENFSAAPIERVIARHPDIVLAAVYAVPDPYVGDQVMTALQLRSGAAFDPESFWAFLRAQPDLGTKWMPRFVRVMEAIPITSTNKVLKRDLRRQHWNVSEPLWWTPMAAGNHAASPANTVWRPFTDDDRRSLTQAFTAAGRTAVLEAF